MELLGDQPRPYEPPSSEADEIFDQLCDEKVVRPLTAAIEKNPEEAEPWWNRAIWYAGRGHWKEAAADFQRALSILPDTNNPAQRPMHAAPVIAMAGRNDYRRYCRELLQRYRDTKDVTTAERIAKACLLLPEASPEMEQACALADFAVERGKDHPYFYYFLFCKGLADYRRKDYRAIVEELEPILPRVDFDDVTTQFHLVLALAREHQGNTKAAREHLARATKKLDERMPDLARSPRTLNRNYEHDWLIAWLLHREAQTLIEGKKAEPTK